MLLKFLITLNVILISYLVYSDINDKHKIAIVRIEDVLTKYSGMDQKRKELTEKARILKANSDSLLHEIQFDIHEFELIQNSLSEKEKIDYQNKIGNKQNQLQRYNSIINEKIQEGGKEFSNEFYSRLQKLVREFGKKSGYEIIYSVSGGNVLYNKSNIDITNEIIDLLNKQ